MNVGMFLTSYFPDRCGGAEQQCRCLSEELVRQGHSVTVLTTRARRDVPRFAVEKGVAVIRLARVEAWFHRLPPPAGAAPAAAIPSPAAGKRRFARLRNRGGGLLRAVNLWGFLLGSAWVMWRKRREIDVWHAHVASLSSGWCAFWAERFGIPAVCKGANLPVFSEEPFLPMKRRLACARRQMSFIALTPEMKGELVAHGVAPERVAVIPNGVGLPAEGPRPDPGEAGPVLYVANLTQPVENKAFDVLFDAWATVHAERPRAQLVVAGAGDPEPWREFLRRRNASDSVAFIGRVDDLAARYREASMLVLPSRREGVSNALLEAQSWGVPAVVSGIPGNLRVVEDGKNGLVVPVGDADALARAIIRLLEEEGLRERLGRAARDRIAADFRIDAIASQVVAWYGHILEVKA